MSKKSRIMIIAIAALAFIAIGTTFASWLINAKQTNFNTITSGCVNISFSNGNGSLNLDNALPIPDGDGIELQGYTFTVKNNCRGEVSYLLNLDLFNVSGSTNLTTDEIKLAIDNYAPRRVTYYDSTPVNNPNAYGAKTIATGTLAGGASESHTVKMWVDENSTTQNAVFSNRLFIKAGPDLTVPKLATDVCFIMADDNTIGFYLTSYCPNNVIIPGTINGYDVTDVIQGAFFDMNAISWFDGNDHVDVIILDEEHYDEISNTINYLFGTSIADHGLIGQSDYVSSYTIYKASEYTNWSTITDDYQNNPETLGWNGDLIDDSQNGTTVKRLLIPYEYDLEELYNLFSSYDIDILRSDPIANNSMYNNNEGNATLIPHYLESIDFTRCTELEAVGSRVAYMDSNLTKVELPNNPTFSLGGLAFANNAITQVFLPTNITNVKNAFSNNRLTHLELYSTDDLVLGPNSFVGNSISSLVVNSTVVFSGNMTNNNKPFRGNSLTASGITIGHNSTNTVADFIPTS